MRTRNELANLIENAWIEYNSAIVSRLHPQKVKETLGNIMINNTPEIIAALRESDATPVETVDVITGDEKDKAPKKVRK